MLNPTPLAKQKGRVLAISHCEGNTCWIYGYGEYVGDFIPKEAVGFMAELGREHKRPNPKIVLENGKVVYGCECWWGDAEKAEKEIIKGRKIIVVDIDEDRKANQ